MRFHFLLALVLSLFATPAAARDMDKACTAASADSTTIVAIQHDYAAWAGRCVRVRGIAFGRHLLSDRKAILESHEGFGEHLKRSLVILPGNVWREQGPLLIEIVGTIGSCKAANEMTLAESVQTGDFVMTSGYCHTSLANYVSPVAVRVLSKAAILRLVEAEVPVARRPLVDAPAGTIGLDDHAAAARAMVDALAARNEVAFGRLFDPEAQRDIDTSGKTPQSEEIPEDMREVHAAFLEYTRRDGVFAALLSGAGPPHMMFVDRTDLDFARESGEAPSGYLGCWCKSANCAGRWPVTVADADNDPARPYVCVRTGLYTIYRAGEVIQVTPIDRPRGFAEPIWPGPDHSPSG